ncbi:protein related to integral membrane protein PTH11 [Ophiocordyceps camponoti-floridani]|uniref:Protein related to integral membrane protein PTH11 n=1 Tax=Ophiocordyceps camponoti-floridani TaxID=2030778 RepID=A0A8H4QCY5_9HYPO|nr:protein related to integral membrane protein PTH11 [Ophiocordyceps camponoti-floridani]
MESDTALAVEGYLYFSIEILLIIWRICERWVTNTFRGLATDDYLMMVAALWNIIGTAASSFIVFITHGLANSGITDAERALLSPESDEFKLRVQGSKAHLVGWVSFATLLWTLKLCWLFFYKRLGYRVDRMAFKVNVGLVFCGVAYAVLICAILFGCVPLWKSWQINPDPGNFCHPASATLQVWVMVVSDVATDLYITIIPLPMIWNARITRVNKIGLLIMFCGGLATMSFSITRFVIIITNNGDEDTQLSSIWSDREAFVAVFVTNVPVLVPLLRKRFWNIRDKSIASVSASRGRDNWNRSRDETTKASRESIASTSSLPKKVLSASAESFCGSESDETYSPRRDRNMRLGM